MIKYDQAGEQISATHQILGVFWSVRRNCLPKFQRKKNLYMYKNKGKYDDVMEYDCKDENYKRFYKRN